MGSVFFLDGQIRAEVAYFDSKVMKCPSEEMERLFVEVLLKPFF